MNILREIIFKKILFNEKFLRLTMSTSSANFTVVAPYHSYMRHFDEVSKKFNAAIPKKQCPTEGSKPKRIAAGYQARVTLETRQFFSVIISCAKKAIDKLPIAEQQKIATEGHFDFECNRPNLYKTWRVAADQRSNYSVTESECSCVTNHILTLSQPGLGFIIQKVNTSKILRKGTVVETPKGRGNFILRLNYTFLNPKKTALPADLAEKKLENQIPFFASQLQETFLQPISEIQKRFKNEKDSKKGVNDKLLVSAIADEDLNRNEGRIAPILPNVEEKNEKGEIAPAAAAPPEIAENEPKTPEFYSIQGIKTGFDTVEALKYAKLLTNQLCATAYPNARRIYRPAGMGVKRISPEEKHQSNLYFAAWLQHIMTDPRWRETPMRYPLSMHDAYRVCTLMIDSHGQRLRSNRKLKTLPPPQFLKFENEESRPNTFQKLYEWYGVKTFLAYLGEIRSRAKALTLEKIKANARKWAFDLIDRYQRGEINTDTFNKKHAETLKKLEVATQSIDAWKNIDQVRAIFEGIVGQLAVGSQQYAVGSMQSENKLHTANCILPTEKLPTEKLPTEIRAQLRTIAQFLKKPAAGTALAEYQKGFDDFLILANQLETATTLTDAERTYIERVRAIVADGEVENEFKLNIVNL